MNTELQVSKIMNAGATTSENSSFFPIDTSDDLVEDDGSVYTEENGIRKNICPGELVRACGVMEMCAFNGHKYKLDNTVMPVWLESKKKLATKDILEALWIVSRQIPHLQFCHAKRRGKLWFKRIIKLEIDFEITTKNVMEVCHDMFDTDYDLWNGPLWKVKLIESNDKTVNDGFGTILIFVILHSLNDGVTNIKIIKDFLITMNKLSANQPVTPVFSPVITPIDKMVKGKTTINFMVKKILTQTFMTFSMYLRNDLHFSNILPLPKTKVAKTRILIDQFTEKETQKIIKLCKDWKITLNTFICTIANFALLNVVQTRSSVPIGRRKIRVAHLINHRRYFEPQYSDAPGYHASVMEDAMKVSLTEAGDFWIAAQKNHSTFLNRLNITKEHLKSLLLSPLALGTRPVNQFLARNGFKGFAMFHYISSNMGNLEKLLPDVKEEDNVGITYLTRSSSNQLTGMLFGLGYHTLRQKLILSMDYYTNFLTEDVAREIFVVLYRFIRNIIHHNRLIMK